MLRFVADDVWQELTSYTAQPGRKRGAFAYVSGDAASILSLKALDLMIIDGSEEALRAGATDPRVVAEWQNRGVLLRSMPGLHAKVLLIDGDPAIAVVGSANVSTRSRDHLREAVIVSDDPDLCAHLNDQLLVWWAQSDTIDDDWFARARLSYMPSTFRPRQRVAPRRAQPLWLGQSLTVRAKRLSTTAQAALDSVATRHGHGSVQTWWMNPGDDKLVRPDHDVVLIETTAGRAQPADTAMAAPPATVAEVIADPEAPIAFLVHHRTARRRRFADVRAAIAGASGRVQWHQPYAAGSPEAAAIRALWR